MSEERQTQYHSGTSHWNITFSSLKKKIFLKRNTRPLSHFPLRGLIEKKLNRHDALKKKEKKHDTYVLMCAQTLIIKWKKKTKSQYFIANGN